MGPFQRSASQTKLFDNNAWKQIRKKLDPEIRRLTLRYGRATDKELEAIVNDVTLSVDFDENFALRDKALYKARGNTNTWKHRTITCMMEWVGKTLTKPSMSFLLNEQDLSRLFEVFESIYSVVDAESVFCWASRYILFYEKIESSELRPNGTASIAPGPFWIKYWFVSLAVKVKLHLDFEQNHGVRNGVPRQVLLNWFDAYPRNQHTNIGPKRLKFKDMYGRRRKMPLIDDQIAQQSIGTLKDDIDWGSADEDGSSNDRPEQFMDDENDDDDDDDHYDDDTNGAYSSRRSLQDVFEEGL
ncbi:hypothetical protein GMDG_08649 [Pseudogymnoascus destructans 20631-21]|uniref:Uncharacterized protein n=1 Tax=Pseudogymnoascus destructans (strain ATCC MYA-4855 / 20631-21) TaxID=658429 RepID=L8G9D9_PSED2|nr:hypothetical protein GMDG_08649 [Pseudogymnoascus destructans 20631-21]